MKRMIQKILESHGTRLRLEHQGEETEIRGFLQPVRSKARQNQEHVIQEMGEYPLGQYVYIGPPEPPAAQGDILWQEERRFVLRRAELLYTAEGAAYCWGLCVDEGTDTWTES